MDNFNKKYVELEFVKQKKNLFTKLWNWIFIINKILKLEFHCQFNLENKSILTWKFETFC